MLFSKGKLEVAIDVDTFIKLVLEARKIEVLPISSEIAAQSILLDAHGDPADRLIASTTIIHKAKLVTPDHKLSRILEAKVVW